MDDRATNFGSMNIKKQTDHRLRRWSEGGQNYDFAQPRFIDKQRTNHEFDDSGFGQGKYHLNVLVWYGFV
jgi:hypothetical protein